MIWAAFSARGRSELAVLRDTQDSAAYISTMLDYMLPFARAMHGDDFVYQQEGASIHTSKLSMSFFRKQGVEVIQWPSRSPNLNPIENLWTALSRIVYRNGKQYSSVVDLTAAVRSAWKEVDEGLCSQLLMSMPRQ